MHVGPVLALQGQDAEVNRSSEAVCSRMSIVGPVVADAVCLFSKVLAF